MTLQTLRDILVSIAAALVIVVIVVSTTNRAEVARWKMDVDEAYWKLYDQRCVDVPNDCIGD